jgi:hypothetical protein
MRGRTSSRGRRLAVVFALACALSPVAIAGASAGDYNREYEQALSVGLQAYVYGQPLLDMQRVYQSLTSVTVADHVGDAPVNQFSHFTELANTKEALVVAPNDDTLYSIAWLKLRPQPIVLHVPASQGRFDVVPLMTPYTENFADIGEGASGMMAPGDYVIAAGKRYEGVAEIDGMKVIHSPYDRAWIIQRTLVKSTEDLPDAVAVQAQTKLVPLDRWRKDGVNYVPPKPAEEVTTPTEYRVPGTAAGEEPLSYWNALGAALEQFKPPAADRPELKLLASVGIGPGKFPANNERLGAGTIAGLRAAVVAGPGRVEKELTSMFLAGFTAHNGWLAADVGKYGTDYSLRAIADKIGLGALPPNVAIYPIAQTERAGFPLNGASTRYVAHFPASDFPVPVQAFWSLTMYETSGFFVANPMERHTLGDRSNLQYEPDGSLNIYIQTEAPATEAEQDNWLLAPAGPFQLIMRLYGTDEAAIAGVLEGGAGHWTPPTILPCLASGKTAAGWNCAS